MGPQNSAQAMIPLALHPDTGATGSEGSMRWPTKTERRTRFTVRTYKVCDHLYTSLAEDAEHTWPRFIAHSLSELRGRNLHPYIASSPSIYDAVSSMPLKRCPEVGCRMNL